MSKELQLMAIVVDAVKKNYFSWWLCEVLFRCTFFEELSVYRMKGNNPMFLIDVELCRFMLLRKFGMPNSVR